MAMFGLTGSYSSKKSSSTQTGTVKDSLDSLVSNLESQSGSKTSSGSTSNSGSQTSQGASNAAQASTTAGQTQQEQTGQSSGSQFASDMLGILKGLTAGQGADLFNTGSGALDYGVSGAKGLAGSFDPAAYVAGVTSKAESDIHDSVLTGVNNFANQIGGTSDGNSMAALLEGKARNQGAATLAGITAEATKTAAETASGLNSSVLTAGNAALAPLLSLAQILKGGETSATDNTKGTQASLTDTSGTSKQNTSESQTSLSQQLTSLYDLFSQLTSGSQTTNSDSVRTLDLLTKGKESGFGITASVKGGS